MPKGEFADRNALSNVTVMGVAKRAPITKVSFNGIALKPAHWHYDAARHLLRVTGLDASTATGAWQTQWFLSWS